MHLHVTKLYCINNLACWRLYSVQTCKGFITFRSRCVGSRRTLTVIGCHTHRHLCPHYRLGAPYPSMNDRPIVVHRSEWWADMTPPIRPGLIYDGHERCMLRDATVGERSVLHRWWCTIHNTTAAVWGLLIRAWWVLYSVKLFPLSGFEIFRNRRILQCTVVTVW